MTNLTRKGSGECTVFVLFSINSDSCCRKHFFIKMMSMQQGLCFHIRNNRYLIIIHNLTLIDLKIWSVHTQYLAIWQVFQKIIVLQPFCVFCMLLRYRYLVWYSSFFYSPCLFETEDPPTMPRYFWHYRYH